MTSGAPAPTVHRPVNSSQDPDLLACFNIMKQASTEQVSTRSERQDDLLQLRRLLLDNRDKIICALRADFRHRAAGETERLELLPSLLGIRHAISNLRAWMAPRRRVGHWATQPSSAKIVPQPLGVVGIISPWNYPLLLSVAPLIGALAAGNRVMIKLSEYCPQFAHLFAEIIEQTFARDKISIFIGDAERSASFSSLCFDHLLFTGSTEIGRKVMRAAAENLTPVTLELGGKSPAVIGRDFSYRRAELRSLVMGKMYNAGQTCVSPDYLLVHKNDEQRLIDAIFAEVTRLYPSLVDNDDYTSIISDRHHHRLSDMLQDATDKGATLHEINPASEPAAAFNTKLPLTLITNATANMRVLQEEIFGPLLPIIRYETHDDAIRYIKTCPRPLAAYVYTRDRGLIRDMERKIVSGALSVNQSTIHVGIESLPFGGVGPSGMGSYHGEAGFMTFSHMKSVYRQRYPNFLALLSPPYETPLRRRAIDILLKL